MQTNQYGGLSDQQVEESRIKHGVNLLTPPQREAIWKLFLKKFNDPIIRILLIAAFLSLGISFLNGHYAETVGVFFAIFLATGVSFWFEYSANKKFDLLNTINDDTQVKVTRNGTIYQVPKKDVVVGDIVLLETGEEVPADGILLEATSLQVNESSLTGEPSIEKSTNPQEFDEEATYPSNHVLRGATVIDGHGVMEVSKVGDATEIGKLAREATATSGEETPLNKQLDKLAKLIALVGLSLSAFTFIALFTKDILLGKASYTPSQLGSIGFVVLTAVVILAKVWLPILYDGLRLAGKQVRLPKRIANGSWLTFIGLGCLTFIVLAAAGFLFGINPLQSSSWISVEQAGVVLSYFMVAVTLMVVSVPEGLPMSVTLSLALSMRKMMATNNLVRKMHACETMGATTVICTDKTGTLTQNQMTVFETNFFGLPEQQVGEEELSLLIKECIAVNSTAHLDLSDPTKPQGLGNPTEVALLLWLNKLGADYLALRESATVVEQITFSTERKFMATMVGSPSLSANVLYMKGAPEIVLAKCSHVRTEKGLEPSEGYKQSIEQLLLKYQSQAMRTLGFAYRKIDAGTTEPIDSLASSSLIFLGFVAISDPVRPDVPAAVQECIDAGIRVVIVTGDTSGTAKEIGRQIGIWLPNEAEENLVVGRDFEAMTDEEAFERVRTLKIMCRARPTDKQRLVQLLQKHNEVVAVTGDGTNDAPALNFAQVGLSMGSGTSVAKEASDITLLDDSFKSIATAVMWGRSLYLNIQRFLIFQLTINVVAVAIVLIGSIFGAELPLTVTQMLWVNLIMDTFAAGALASLPPDALVMKEKPRKAGSFIITSPMRFNILAISTAFVVALLGLLYYFTDVSGEINRYNLSRFFTIFVMLQVWNMFNAKAFATGKSAFYELSKSKAFVAVIGIILVGQALIVQLGGDVFRTTPISAKDWLIIISSTSLVLWIGEITRLIKRRLIKSSLRYTDAA